MNNTPIDRSGPAFPVDRMTAHNIAIHTVGSQDEAVYIAEIARLSHGMSLRDYFAAKAMHAIMTMPSPLPMTVADVAMLAHKMADAMLKAREA